MYRVCHAICNAFIFSPIFFSRVHPQRTECCVYVVTSAASVVFFARLYTMGTDLVVLGPLFSTVKKDPAIFTVWRTAEILVANCKSRDGSGQRIGLYLLTPLVTQLPQHSGTFYCLDCTVVQKGLRSWTAVMMLFHAASLPSELPYSYLATLIPSFYRFAVCHPT